MDKEVKKTVQLSYAIPVPRGDGEEPVMVKELSLGRLKVKHLRAIPREALLGGEDIDPLVAVTLIAGMSGLPESSIDEMDARDLKKVVTSLEDFLKDFLEDGEKRSTE